eukprot:TRINITY_DN5278_c0_g1_i1.p1 TRINITY_DN5278_c0_g1~~TRINITY_DN5278_c0_g1_i1.p1  ORF type:complete len:263 (-),score=65.96 TRINITY_DN5278_c0_g1_i1:1152-1940(-)
MASSTTSTGSSSSGSLFSSSSSGSLFSKSSSSSSSLFSKPQSSSSSLFSKPSSLFSSPSSKTLSSLSSSSARLSSSSSLFSSSSLSSSSMPLRQEQNAKPKDIECIKCHSLSYSHDFFNAFGVCVCRSCLKTSDDFVLISKSEAKTQYLLSDSDFSDLKFLSRPNKQHPSWAPMKLFLRPQVEAKSKAKFGETTDMGKLKQKREVKRLEKRITTEKNKRRRELPPKSYAPPEKHCHLFKTETDGDKIIQKCACGYVLESEAD